MKSYTTTALGIALKIWFIALLINTIADTLLIDGFGGDSISIFLLIGFFGGMFSAPIFLVTEIMIQSFLKNEKSAAYIFKWVLIAGVSLAIAAWAVFANIVGSLGNELLRLAIASPISGAIAICAAYPNIRKACHTRDENNTLPKFDAAQTIAG